MANKVTLRYWSKGVDKERDINQDIEQLSTSMMGSAKPSIDHTGIDIGRSHREASDVQIKFIYNAF